MEGLLIKNYVFLTFLVEFIAATTGVFLLKTYRNTPVKYFIYFLIATFCCDVLGAYTALVKKDALLEFLIGTKFQSNYWLFTVSWDMGAPLFYVFYYYKILNFKWFKSIIKYSCYGFIALAIGCITINWDAFFNQFFNLIVIPGSVLILMCVVFYFIETLQSDRVLHFYKSVYFYISFTLFVWWLIIMPLTFYDVYYTFDFSTNTYNDMHYVVLRRYIYLFANLFMYLSFTFALLWCKPQNN